MGEWLRGTYRSIGISLLASGAVVSGCGDLTSDLSATDTVGPVGVSQAAVPLKVPFLTGAPGQIVAVPVFLETGGLDIAGIDVTISLPNPGAELLVTGGGRPDCEVNPAINKRATEFALRPHGCVPGDGCTGARAVILSFDNSAPISAPVEVFSCNVRILDETEGIVPVVCSQADAASPVGVLLPVACTGGGIVIETQTPATPTATPTPAHAPPEVQFSFGTARGAFGDWVTIPVTMRSTSAAVVGVRLDMDLPNDGAEFGVTGSGEPDCMVNPALGKNSSVFGFIPHDCTRGVDCSRVRALILSFYNIDPIPDVAELFSCSLRITTTAPGVVPLVCEGAEASPASPTEDSDLFPNVCSGGGIIVNADGTPTYTATALPTLSATPVPPSTQTPQATASGTASPTNPPILTPTPLATETAIATETMTAVPTPSASPSATTSPTVTPRPCDGDCNGNGRVSVNELILGVGIALGNIAPAECPALDRNGDGILAVSELIRAVTNALGGCM